MDLATKLVSFFESYGAWGLVVVLMGVVVYLYRDFKNVVDKKDMLIQELNTTHHKEIVDVVKECTGVLTTVNESLERCERRQEVHR